MSVASSGYVHISLRNRQKPVGPRGLANRRALPPTGPMPVVGHFSGLRSVPTGSDAATSAPVEVTAAESESSARGFVIYVGLDEQAAAESGTSLVKLVQELRALVRTAVPGADSYAAVALAPNDAVGSDLEVVRSTLGDPTITGVRSRQPEPAPAPTVNRPTGVLIDLSRREVFLDGELLNLTFKEFELLNFLVENGTRTVSRDELLNGLWRNAEEAPNERTIDVHIRRLRSKLGRLANTVRTVRGQGYRFYDHPEVVVWAAPEYSI
ncbi:winged helix-turn-helix domain-containing protein [Tersicoccus sp. Bi-70]|uniref:winged helix-turn-helix domain-containing protein n=1 Tax=Tersicoccus sp. Bi-70 TaxID=1897634 RepID=UPI000977F79D|nr:winged helix-turn-helix domain-containing protein [Tersicoccus sp. Bi-70]OMH30682.1 transcriptional regulator [Tersicoccus sp. Bi-70]